MQIGKQIGTSPIQIIDKLKIVDILVLLLFTKFKKWLFKKKKLQFKNEQNKIRNFFTNFDKYIFIRNGQLGNPDGFLASK